MRPQLAGIAQNRRGLRPSQATERPEFHLPRARQRSRWRQAARNRRPHARDRIGFKSTLPLKPKCAEANKHPYDFGSATVFGSRKNHGPEAEIALNIEQSSTLLDGRTFEHEIVTAQSLGIFGSIDMNRGDDLLGWDTDQFPNNLPQMALALYHIVKGGGFTSGGLNFDAKLRRQSIDSDDLVIGHASAMDLCARALLVSEKTIQDGVLQSFVAERYAGWNGAFGKSILNGRHSLDDLAKWVHKGDVEPQPRSGKQEWLEALVNSYL